MSNTAHDQAWQLEQQGLTGNGEPGPSTSSAISASPTKMPSAASTETSDDVLAPTLSGDVTMGEPGVGTSKLSEAAASQAVQPRREVDVNTGKDFAGWVLRVEGRVVDVSSIGGHARSSLSWTQSGNARLDKTRRKFSTFLRSAVVEFDNRAPPTFPEGNVVEVRLTEYVLKVWLNDITVASANPTSSSRWLRSATTRRCQCQLPHRPSHRSLS